MLIGNIFLWEAVIKLLSLPAIQDVVNRFDVIQGFLLFQSVQTHSECFHQNQMSGKTYILCWKWNCRISYVMTDVSLKWENYFIAIYNYLEVNSECEWPVSK